MWISSISITSITGFICVVKIIQILYLTKRYYISKDALVWVGLNIEES